MKNLEEVIKKVARERKGARLSEFIKEVASRAKISYDRASYYTYLAWKKGIIDILPEKLPKTFPQYFLSMESLWFHILFVFVVSTILLALYVTKPPLIYLRYVFGSLYVLYVPGAVLLEALYPRGEELEPLERLALSIGLSLALVPLVGLILNYTPWGIRLVPIIISLALLTLSLAIIALYRKYTYFKLKFLT